MDDLDKLKYNNDEYGAIWICVFLIPSDFSLFTNDNISGNLSKLDPCKLILWSEVKFIRCSTDSNLGVLINFNVLILPQSMHPLGSDLICETDKSINSIDGRYTKLSIDFRFGE